MYVALIICSSCLLFHRVSFIGRAVNWRAVVPQPREYNTGVRFVLYNTGARFVLYNTGVRFVLYNTDVRCGMYNTGVRCGV